KYIYWFDIVYTDTSINHVLSKFEIDVNERGKNELSANGIPFSFPAISVHSNSDYRFFYFSGDFCDNPIRLISSYFKGSGHFLRFAALLSSGSAVNCMLLLIR